MRKFSFFSTIITENIATDLQNVAAIQNEEVDTRISFDEKRNTHSNHDSQSTQLMKSNTQTEIIINGHNSSYSPSQTYNLDLISDMDVVSSAQQHINTVDHIQLQDRNNNEALGNIIQHI